MSPASRSTRSRISRAALLVNVMAKIDHGGTPSSISRAMRCVSTRGFCRCPRPPARAAAHRRAARLRRLRRIQSFQINHGVPPAIRAHGGIHPRHSSGSGSRARWWRTRRPVFAAISAYVTPSRNSRATSSRWERSFSSRIVIKSSMKARAVLLVFHADQRANQVVRERVAPLWFKHAYHPIRAQQDPERRAWPAASRAGPNAPPGIALYFTTEKQIAQGGIDEFARAPGREENPMEAENFLANRKLN